MCMSKYRCVLSILFLAALLLAAVPLWADPSKSDSQVDPGAEDEGDLYRIPPIPVDPRLMQYDDLWIRELAGKIADGTANMPERRAFNWLVERLYPYEKPMPRYWQVEAKEALEKIGPRPAEKGESTPSWTLLGPSHLYTQTIANSGRATALWVDPANKNIIIMGIADGGVWKTTDQGVTWTSLTDGISTQSIGAIAVDPSNKNIIYVGTGEGNWGGDNLPGIGIYKSTNGGASWDLQTLPWSMPPPNQNIRRIAIDPRNTQRVYAAGDGGLFITTNGGTNWALNICGGMNLPPYHATDVVLDSVTPAGGQPSIVYCAFGFPSSSAAANTVYRSFDAGATWQDIANIMPGTVGRIVLLTAPSQPKRLYALLQDLYTNGSGIYYTDDATALFGVWWNGGAANPNFCQGQCWYDITGVVDPNNANKVFVGGIDSYVSTAAGANLTKISCWNCYGAPADYAHADQHHMWMPDSSTIYAAGDGGLFVGAVSGSSVSWTARNMNLPTLQFFSMCQHPTDPNKIAGGLQDNGHAYTADGTTWVMAEGGDGGDSAWDQDSPEITYEEYVYGYISRNNNTTADPYSWTCIRNHGGCTNCQDYGCVPDGRTAFIAPFELDINNQNTMYTGTYRIWKNASVRTGNSWSAISGDLTGGGSAYITAIHPAKNNGSSGIIYSGSLDGKVHVTTNGGANWTDRSSGLPQATVKCFATHPTDGNKVLVTFSGYQAQHIYRSTNGGASWVNITGGLPPEPANTVVLDPSDPNHAFVGLDVGVVENTNVWSSSAWSDASYNIPAASVHELQFNPSTGKLRAATHGRSIWELSADSCRVTCTATVPGTGSTSTAVSFYSSSQPENCSGSPTYSWNFGDGSTSTQQSPSHSYASTGTFGWSLSVTVDGQICTQNGSIIISAPANYCPADTDDNWSIAIAEVTAYGSAWKTGQTWPRPPNPIPISYVTRAGQIWKLGEVYHYSGGDDPPWIAGVRKDSDRAEVSPGASGGSAIGSFNRDSYRPGRSLQVTLAVSPNPGTAAFAVLDGPPVGWAVSDISDGGVYDAINHQVKWGPFLDDAARTLEYTVIPQKGAKGWASFERVASFDGCLTEFSGDHSVNGIDRIRKKKPIH